MDKAYQVLKRSSCDLMKDSTECSSDRIQAMQNIAGGRIAYERCWGDPKKAKEISWETIHEECQEIRSMISDHRISIPVFSRVSVVDYQLKRMRDVPLRESAIGGWIRRYVYINDLACIFLVMQLLGFVHIDGPLGLNTNNANDFMVRIAALYLGWILFIFVIHKRKREIEIAWEHESFSEWVRAGRIVPEFAWNAVEAVWEKNAAVVFDVCFFNTGHSYNYLFPVLRMRLPDGTLYFIHVWDCSVSLSDEPIV